MTSNRRTPFHMRMAAAAVSGGFLLTAALSACGSSDSSSSGSGDTVAAADTTAAAAVTVNEDAVALLPDSLKSAGKLKVAVTSGWPPFAVKNSDGTLGGMEVALVQQVAAKLGLEVEFSDLAFASIVPGVTNGRFDIGAAELGDTEERRKDLSFVDYYSAGMSLLVKKGTTGIDPTDLCGHKIAVPTGSIQEQEVTAFSKECTDSGKEAIDKVVLPDDAQTEQAVMSGRAEAFMTDDAVAHYTTSINDELENVPGEVETTPMNAGMAIKKDNTGLIKAVQMVVQELIDDGSVAKDFGQYGVTAGLLPKALINGEAQ